MRPLNSSWLPGHDVLETTPTVTFVNKPTVPAQELVPRLFNAPRPSVPEPSNHRVAGPMLTPSYNRSSAPLKTTRAKLEGTKTPLAPAPTRPADTMVIP